MADRGMRQEIEKMLRALGAEHRFLPRRGRGRHPSIELQTAAGPRRIFIPGTPGRGRSTANTLALLKRALRKSP